MASRRRQHNYIRKYENDAHKRTQLLLLLLLLSFSLSPALLLFDFVLFTVHTYLFLRDFVVNIDLVGDQNAGNVLAIVSEFFIPVSEVLVSRFPRHVEHQNARICPVVIRRVHLIPTQ